MSVETRPWLPPEASALRPEGRGSLIDLNRRRIEVHSHPGGRGDESFYAQCRIYTEDEEVPVVLDGREHVNISARELLP